jgi:hypothetical protein
MLLPQFSFMMRLRTSDPGQGPFARSRTWGTKMGIRNGAGIPTQLRRTLLGSWYSIQICPSFGAYCTNSFLGGRHVRGGSGREFLSRECRSIPASEKTPKVLAAGIAQPSSMLVRFQDNRATFRLAIVPHCNAIFLRLLCLSNLESIT